MQTTALLTLFCCLAQDASAFYATQSITLRPLHNISPSSRVGISLRCKHGRRFGGRTVLSPNLGRLKMSQPSIHSSSLIVSFYSAFEFIGHRLPSAFFKELGMIDDHPILLAIYFLSNLAFPAAGIRMLMVRDRPNRRLGWLIIMVGFISAAFHWYVFPNLMFRSTLLSLSSPCSALSQTPLLSGINIPWAARAR